MIEEFSLENFRVFRDKTTFKFKPITILTGPNNGGKSSVNKALLLMKENFADSKIQHGISSFPDLVNFSKGSHFLGNFNKIASFNSSKVGNLHSPSTKDFAMSNVTEFSLHSFHSNPVL